MWQSFYFNQILNEHDYLVVVWNDIVPKEKNQNVTYS